jgi:lipopolysaccharide biosynthesis glycosyltransferase
MNKICMSFDNAYLVPGLITLKSLKVNSIKNFELTLINLNCSLDTYNSHLILEWCERNGIEVVIVPVFVDESLFRVDARISLASYGRIYAIKLMNHPFIYLDSDLLAYNLWDGIFLELESLQQDDNSILGSRERNFSGKNSRNLARRLAGDNYFSAAVMGINPNKVDSALFMEKVHSVLEGYEESHLWAHDQDVLNQIFHKELTDLNSIYNTNIWNKQPSEPHILHFDGFFKPWKLSLFGFLITVFLAAGFDLIDRFRTGSDPFRFKGFLQYKKLQREVERELKKVEERLEQEGSKKAYTKELKKINTLQILGHLMHRVGGSNAAKTF